MSRRLAFLNLFFALLSPPNVKVLPKSKATHRRLRLSYKCLVMKTLYTLLLMMIIALRSVAQTGEIAGTVLDEKKQPIIGAVIQLTRGGISKGGAVTDYDGKYLIKPLDPGSYTLVANSIGYIKVTVNDIVVDRGRIEQNINMTPASNQLQEVRIGWKKPLINKQSGVTLQSQEIKRLPTTQVSDMASLSPGVYQQQRGRGIPIGGARKTGTLYIIDGVQVQNIGGESQGLQMPQNTSEYKKVAENDFRNVAANPLSTMSVDVDRAAYANVRRFIIEGNRPPVDAVRIEEMVNYFNYEYAQPGGTDPITISGELTECPWNEGHLLLRVGIQAIKPDTKDLPAGNFVFLIDVSGSMNSYDKLPLLLDGMRMLVEKMRPVDKVSIVTYAGAAGLVLPPTPGNKKEEILAALNRLSAGGSTAGGAGIMLAYKTAEEHFIKGGNNRVILATDGDFNVGVSNDNELEALITKKRETGVYLTCLGFGNDNYKDAKLEMLADKGNGNYHYIDNIKEAQKSLVEEFGGTMFTVAKDVKAQIEFNPAKVQGYRVLGYENRMLNTEDFKDDKKDAGDMGAGHTVTILYEIIPSGTACADMRKVNKLKYAKTALTLTGTNTDELATIKFRYKKPDGNRSTEMEYVIKNTTTEWKEATDNTRFAASVALFGMLTRESKYAGDATYADAIAMAQQCDLNNDSRTEFLSLVKAMKAINERTSVK